MSEQTHPLWNQFIRVVQEEVKPALGCTEPVSLALACAIAAEHLSGDVTQIEAWVSPNLICRRGPITLSAIVRTPTSPSISRRPGSARRACAQHCPSPGHSSIAHSHPTAE